MGRKIIVFILTIVLLISDGMTVMASSLPVEKITVMSNLTEDIMKPYIQAFEKKYPNIKVDYRYYENYDKAMKTRFEKNKIGDVVFIPGDIDTNSYPDYFVPLGNLDQLTKKYRYLEESKRVNNQVYGLPSSAYITGIVYNTEVFDKAGITQTPKSTDDFLQDLRMIKDRTDAIPFYTNYSAQWTLQFWETFPYFDMTGDPNFKNNGFLYQKNPYAKGTTHYEVYHLLYDIVAEKLCEINPRADDWEKSKEMLNNGEIGCMVVGSWAISQIQKAGEHGDSIAFMPFPNQIEGKQYATISTDYCYGISKKSRCKAAARKYIDFMMDESGYAIDQQVFSLVKTDPYPDVYGDMDQVIMSNNIPATDLNYKRKLALSANLNMDDNSPAARVIEAAAGYSNESFDDIIKDWDDRWESGRPADMQDEMADDTKTQKIERSVIVGDYDVMLSNTEKSFLKETKKIKVGYLDDIAPFQYETSEKEFSGLSKQICDTIQKLTGLSMEYVKFSNKDDLISALNKGKIQMAAGLDSKEQTSSDLRFSKSYMDCMKVMVKNNHANLDNLSKKNEAVVTQEGNKSTFSTESSKIVQSDTLSAALQKVNYGKADYTVGNYYCVEYYINKMGLQNITVVPLSDKGSISLAFAADADTRLISICNKCLYEIPSEQIQVMLMDDMDPGAKPVTLARFVKENPFATVGIMLVFNVIILSIVFLALRQKWMNERRHAMDVKRYETLSKLTDEYVFEYDHETEKMHFDQKFLTKFDVRKDFSVIDYKPGNVFLDAFLEEYNKMIDQNIQESKPFVIERNGKKEWYRLIVYTLEDENGVQSNVIGKVVDATQEIKEQEHLLEEAQKDPLTGLYNRDAFKKRFNNLKDKQSLLFAIMDLDNFKTVNDKLGHAGGDRALKYLADCLAEKFKNDAILCRYGGDEFILCAYDYTQEEAENRLADLVKTMDCEMEYHKQKMHLSISLGAVYSTQMLQQKQLFNIADTALYQVKENGKNNWNMQVQ